MSARRGPPWEEGLRGIDHELIGLLEPTFDPPSRLDARFDPSTGKPLGYIPVSWYGTRLCDAHWRPVPSFAEFQALFTLRESQRTARRSEILQQHERRFVLSSCFHRAVTSARARCGGDGSFSDVRDMFALCEPAQQDIDLLVLHQKLLYNRARPFQYFPELDPPICPAHASYPSGHSTSAHGLAYLLDAALDVPGDPHRRERDEISRIAFRVAENREVAGVHFRSDTEAGMALARFCVDEMCRTSFAEKIAYLKSRFTA